MSKNIIILLLVLFTLISCEDNIGLQQAANNNTQVVKQVKNKQEVSNLKSVGVGEFKKELEKGDGILVDLRTSEEVKQGIIPGVKLNLDYYAQDFLDKLKSLDKNKKYLIYCRSGHRSGNTLKKMKELDFKNVINLEHGINSWKQAGEKLGVLLENDYFNIKK